MSDKDDCPKSSRPFHGYKVTIDIDKIPVMVIFDTYRKYIEHQYSLMNHRVNWFININSFLFATYGFSIQKKMDATSQAIQTNLFLVSNIKHLDFFMAVIGLVGIALSILCFKLLRAANRPIHQLFIAADKMFADVTAEKSAHEINRGILPFIVGGFEAENYQNGRRLTTYIPIVVGATWVLVLWFTGIFSIIIAAFAPGMIQN